MFHSFLTHYLKTAFFNYFFLKQKLKQVSKKDTKILFIFLDLSEKQTFIFMALQSTRKISLIKIIVSQQASQSFTNRTVATSSSNCRTRRSILFTNSSTNTDRSQSIFRLACTTSKKSTAFTHNVPEHTFADLPSGKQLDLTFSDSKTAFKSKTNFELLRGYLVFELCGVKFLLDNQQKVNFHLKIDHCELCN